MISKGLDLFHSQKAPNSPRNDQFVVERNQTVFSLEITLEELAAAANDLNLPANRLRPDLLLSYLLTANGNQNVTGFASVWPGRKCIVINRDAADTVTLQHQNAGSAAPHRIISPTGADYAIGPYESAHLVYLGPDARWIITGGTGA